MSGVCAAIFQMLADINSQIPMVGASGAIAGVLGAYMYLFPKSKNIGTRTTFNFFFYNKTSCSFSNWYVDHNSIYKYKFC